MLSDKYKQTIGTPANDASVTEFMPKRSLARLTVCAHRLTAMRNEGEKLWLG